MALRRGEERTPRKQSIRRSEAGRSSRVHIAPAVPKCLSGPGNQPRRAHVIDVHYWPTPNGKKVTILLEELGTPYNIVPLNIGRGDQFEDSFLRISPNNRMPAIVDHAPKDGGAPVSVFESGAIVLYLAEEAGRFWPLDDVRTRYEVV